MQEVTPNAYADILRAAFNQICDPNDWKAPIDALVPAAGFKIYQDAIQFMTATHPTIHERDADGKRFYLNRQQAFRITSEGYRNGPAGDH